MAREKKDFFSVFPTFFFVFTCHSNQLFSVYHWNAKNIPQIKLIQKHKRYLNFHFFSSLNYVSYSPTSCFYYVKGGKCNVRERNIRKDAVFTWCGDWGGCGDGLQGAPIWGCCCWGPGLCGGGAWGDWAGGGPRFVCGPGLAAGEGHCWVEKRFVSNRT